MQEARQMLIILMQFIIPIVMVMYARLFHVSITIAGRTQVKYQIQLQLLLAFSPVCLHHQSRSRIVSCLVEEGSNDLTLIDTCFIAELPS
jgi:hypothetical protein